MSSRIILLALAGVSSCVGVAAEAAPRAANPKGSQSKLPNAEEPAGGVDPYTKIGGGFYPRAPRTLDSIAAFDGLAITEAECAIGEDSGWHWHKLYGMEDSICVDSPNRAWMELCQKCVWRWANFYYLRFIDAIESGASSGEN